MVEKFTRDEIKDLVKRYGLACNALLELQKSDLINLWLKIYQVYLAGQTDVVIEVTKELLSSGDLPEPVHNHWKSFWSKIDV